MSSPQSPPTESVTQSPTLSPIQTEHISINLELREKIWSGCVPILFNMASNEVISKKDPVSIFLLLPRISYLPLVTEKVHNHFVSYAPALSDGMWFEFNGHALKWNFPIGLLYDLYIYEQHKINNNNNTTGDPVWKLIVHFQSYPSEDIIMACNNKNVVKISFFNYLKQSVFLSYNNINAISSLKKNDQNALWNGVCKADFNLYFPIYQLIFGRLSNKNNKMIRFPFRIILRGFNDDNKYKNIDLIPIQRPINVENNIKLTLNKCLNDIIPGIMEMYNNANKNNNYTIDIIVQGMKIPLNVPIMWLVRHATYADCFLYVVIVKY
eukprot:218293_1